MDQKLLNLGPETLIEIIKIQKQVAEAGLNLGLVMQSIVDGIQDLLKFDGTVVEVLEQDDFVFKATSGPLPLGKVGFRVPRALSLSGLSLKSRDILKCDDVSTDPRVDLEACRKLGLGSMVVAPFKTSGGTHGVLKVMSAETHMFTEHHTLIISILADALAATFRNAEIADQIKAQIEQRSAELQVKSDALENSLNGFDIINEQGVFIYANKAYLRMWGYDALEEILGTSPVDHCADPDTPYKIISALHEHGECNIEFVARRKDGSFFDVLMWARMAHGTNGEVIYPTTSIDITERKKNESKLKEAIHARDNFLSIASHELNTPLTSLKLQTQMRMRNLTQGKLQYFAPEALLKLLQSDNRHIDRLSRLVEDMLDITRINSGKLKMRVEEFDLKKLVLDVAEKYVQESVGTRPSIQVQGPQKVHGAWDKFRLEQVISNLLSNALKYGAGGPVTVKLFTLKSSVRMIVEDKGIGISPDDQARIFNRFERAVESNEISGLGLGLYIVKEIIERHQGSIRVESALGSGSAFIVDLPLNP